MSIGEKVRQLRLAQGLNASELARRSGLPPATVSRVEQGISSPTSETVAKLAQGLQVDPGTLFPKVESPQPSPVSQFVESAGELEALFEEDPQTLRAHLERVRDVQDIKAKLARRAVDSLPSGPETDRASKQFMEAQMAVGRVWMYFVNSPAGGDLEITGEPRRGSDSAQDTDVGEAAG